uniref:NR LBD domain-containing protein n=1 Tax=Rhabditophanes sp. KR3021 TaxID=114890 RepID=A0AC35UHG0_9BILA
MSSRSTSQNVTTVIACEHNSSNNGMQGISKTKATDKIINIVRRYISDYKSPMIRTRLLKKDLMRAVTHFTEQQAVINLNNNKKLVINVEQISKVSKFFNSALKGPFNSFCSGRKEINLEQFSYGSVRTVLKVAEHLSVCKPTSYIKQFNMATILQLFEVASYLMVDSVITRLSHHILSTTDNSEIARVYGNVKMLDTFTANKLFEQMVRRFKYLLANETIFMHLEPDEFLKLVFNQKTKLPIYGKVKVLKYYIKYNSIAGREVQMVKQQLIDIMTSMVFTSQTNYSYNYSQIY